MQELAQLCQHCGFRPENRTQHIKKLGQIVNDLKILGFYLTSAHELKTCHLYALIELWRAENMSLDDIKSRLKILYWWADRLERGWIFPADFDQYTPDLPTVLTNPAWSLSGKPRLHDKTQEYVLLLMEGFGLQFSEAFNIKIAQAYKRDYLLVAHDWLYGQHEREIPIISTAQRNLLMTLKRTYNHHPLKPEIVTDTKYLNHIKANMQQLGMRDMQGLRYRYAQRRYEEITRQYCPLAGGQPTHCLRPDLRIVDREARAMIRVELGLTAQEQIQTFLG